MRRWIAGLALLLAVTVSSAAEASIIRIDASRVYFDGGVNDQVTLLVNSGWDADYNDVGVFFIPLTNTGYPDHVHPTTTDANCRASTVTTSTCRLGSTRDVLITSGSRNDFVRIASAGNHLIFRAGAGDDRSFPDFGTRLTAYGEAGNDTFMGNAGFDTFDGGTGDDTLVPIGIGDVVFGGPDFDTVQMQSGGVVVTLDDQANDGKAGENQNVHSDVERVLGGPDGDTLEGNAGANTLNGNDGNDTLNGLGGADALSGGAGADVIHARDGTADSVACGPGDDRALVDPVDTVAPDCETAVYADSDQDGVDARSDCDDANPAVRPGATEVAGNGIDEDCSGADAAVIVTPLPGNTTIITGAIDGDRDGTSPPLDCDDADAGRHPGAADTPGDRVDQDCSGADAAFPILQARVQHRWKLSGAWSRVVELTVADAPAKATVTVRCAGRGCPFKSRSVSTKSGGARLAKLFKQRKLSTGAVVDVVVAAPGFVSKVVRFTIKGKRKLPQQRNLCQPPGVSSPRACA